jgi:ADP-heptose:LPS heptosyltransferase
VKPLEAPVRLVDLRDELKDFADTAAIVANLDLVITVDTAVAHLAGALGKPVWILLTNAPDWRWFLEREDSPWYPTARLFRQSRHGNWQEVLARLERELRQLLAGPGPTGRNAIPRSGTSR